MFDPSYILLYVRNPAASAAFYQSILGYAPVELSPAFALFKLASGVKLGLWDISDAEPAAELLGGGSELAISLADQASVDACYQDWKNRGLTLLQSPCQMDFGYTFVAQDPDAHRIRVFTPAVCE